MTMPWCMDMLSNSNFGSMNLMYNQCYADSAARWYMSNPWTTGFGFMPYSFNSYDNFGGFLNPIYSWNQAAFNIFGNNGGWNMNVQNPFNTWGWYSNGGASNGGKKEDLSDGEIAAKSKYETLKKLLNQYVKEIENEEPDTAEIISNKLNNSKKETYEEKYKELLGIYKKYTSSDIKTFRACINKINSVKIDGKNQTIEDWLKYINGDGLSDVAEQIKIDLDNCQNADSNIDKLDNVDQKNVLGVISAFNSKYGDLASYIYSKYQNASQKTTALYSINKAVNALTDAAKAIADDRNIDPETSKAINDKIKALSETVKGESLGSNFAIAFNELYVMTKLAIVKRLEKPMITKYGDIDKTLVNYSETTIAALKSEFQKTSSVDIDKLAAKVKCTESPKKVVKSENEDEEVVEEDISETTVNSLINDKILVKTEHMYDKLPVYHEEKSNRYYIVDNGKVYEVTKNGTKITKAQNAEEIMPGLIKEIYNSAKEKNELIKALENDENFSTATVNGTTVYTVKVVGKDYQYIINDSNKLQEVEVNDGTITVKNNTELTFKQLQKSIKDKKAHRKDELNLSKLLSSENNFIMEGTAISDGNWSAYINDNFKTGLGKCFLKLKNDWNSDNPYTQKEWEDAVDATINYYKDALANLSYADDWNSKYKEGTNGNKSGIYSAPTWTYNDKNGNQCQIQSYTHDDGGKVNSYMELKKRDTSVDADIYIGCDYDSWWCNDFYIYLNPDKVIERFKSFLPK